MKHLLTALLAIVAAGTASAVSADFRCMKATDAAKPIRLQFEFPQKNEAMGHVSYERGNGRIPVRLIATTTMETDPDRPLEFTTTWKEAVSNGVPGTYIVVTQGAQVYGFTYVRGKDHKKFEFDEDLAASDERHCTWKGR